MLLDAPITAAYWVSQVNVSQVNISQENAAMGWLRLAARGSLKLQVSFAKEPYKRDYILQKRPIILRSLLNRSHPIDVQSCWVSHVNVSQVHVAHHSLVVRHDSFTRVSQVNVAVSQLESEYKWMSHKCMLRIIHLLWDMTPSHVSHMWMLRSHTVSTSECLTSECCASFTCETWLLHMCLTL